MEQEIQQILLLTNGLLSLMRSDTKDANITNLLDKLIYQYKISLLQWKYIELVESILEEVPFLIFEDKQDFKKYCNISINSCSGTIKNLSEIKKYQPVFCTIFKDCIKLYESNEFENLSDLLDAIHALPEALTNTNWNERRYWKTYINCYRKKWNKKYLNKIQKEIVKYHLFLI